jgi:uncharacterized membrane protein
MMLWFKVFEGNLFHILVSYILYLLRIFIVHTSTSINMKLLAYSLKLTEKAMAHGKLISVM